MTRTEKLDYIAERLGDVATRKDAERVLEALEAVGVVVPGDPDTRRWLEDIKDVPFLDVLEDVENGAETSVALYDRWGFMRSVFGPAAAVYVVVERWKKADAGNYVRWT